MARETKAQKARRVGDMLAEYNRLTEMVSKAQADIKALQPQIRELDAGAYGDWVLTFGTPRTIMDQQATRELLASLEHEVPMTKTQAPIQVNPKGGK